ncbi:hypothetical protein HPP92_025014 [Vanilla planifolia]|uniref:Uncharacterized protein n=1 Tax=Vanilla planifolia TaxID=51239 RepID=A0A835PH33_VANPL|nr:hypothetical protein HPP92_025014 [Vanilla planifolia]
MNPTDRPSHGACLPLVGTSLFRPICLSYGPWEHPWLQNQTLVLIKAPIDCGAQHEVPTCCTSRLAALSQDFELVYLELTKLYFEMKSLKCRTTWAHDPSDALCWSRDIEHGNRHRQWRRW